jgi:anaerobic selenocysteine-containing dehydrogenase
MIEQVKSVCRMCHGGCGAVLNIENNRIVSIAGDRDNPNNRGFLCAKGRASLDHLYHPDRLQFPLKRVGARGSNDFQRITWDEAYATIVDQMKAARAEGGPEAVAFAQGTDRNYQEWLFRFAHAFGSPNVLGPAHVCFYPRMMAGILSMGDFTFCDYEGTPECLLVWGSNKIMTHGDGVIGTRLLAARKRGTELVVIDPRRTELAQRARYWLQVRPGTDVALALAMINVIISSKSFDAQFVEQHTSGFDVLAQHAAQFTPEVASRITSVPAALIEEASLYYARARSAAIEAGTGIEQNRNSFHTARALCILSAISGNIDRPGGDIIWQPSGIVGRREFPLEEALPESQRRKRLGSEQHRVLGMASWAHPGAVWKAIVDHKPYRVHAMLVFGSNLLVSYADSERVRAALQSLSFLAVADLFMTPTAALADIVLPIAGWLERDQIVEHAHYSAARRKLAQVGESRSDEQVILDLAERLSLGGSFWPSLQAALDHKLAPINQDWQGFALRYYHGNLPEYFKYRKHGFRTRTGKFNLYCEALNKLGYSPLPSYQAVESSAASKKRYVLTSAHSRFYFNSEFRNIKALRKREPDPVIEIHPETAELEKVADRSWVLVHANGRSARFKARITDSIAPGIVCVSSNWWYPELSSSESWRRSNINLLTVNEDENEEMGSSNFRGISCSLESLGEEIAPSETSMPDMAAAELNRQERSRQAPGHSHKVIAGDGVTYFKQTRG